MMHCNDIKKGMVNLSDKGMKDGLHLLSSLKSIEQAEPV